jgi:hypothetical protein
MLQSLRVFRLSLFQRSQVASGVETIELPHKKRPALLRPRPHAKASIAEKIQFLHQQLDSMGKDAEILPGLILLGIGGKERLQGGVLQFLYILHLHLNAAHFFVFMLCLFNTLMNAVHAPCSSY